MVMIIMKITTITVIMKMMMIISSGRFDGIHIFESFLARSNSSNGISHRAQVALIRSISAHEWVGVWTVSYNGYNTVITHCLHAIHTCVCPLRVMGTHSTSASHRWPLPLLPRRELGLTWRSFRNLHTKKRIIMTTTPSTTHDKALW